jgi:hypothetical protein
MDLGVGTVTVLSPAITAGEIKVTASAVVVSRFFII